MKMRKTDMVTSGSEYNRAKGSARVGSKSAPDQPKKGGIPKSQLAGWMDSRPENSDRNQSAK